MGECALNFLKFVKLTGLIAGVALLNIIVLSPGLLGMQLSGGNALETALAVTILIMSLLSLVYGSYVLLLKPPPPPPPVKIIRTHEDYITALRHYRNEREVRDNVLLALDQLERIGKKRETLAEVLSQRFNPEELSYRKFESVIEEVGKLFYLNTRGILNKLSVFDPSEWASLASRQKSAKLSARLLQEKSALYGEYMEHIVGYLEANEEILLKLDKLLLEISLLESADYREIEDMPGMKEMDALIKQTKYYKQ
ncbi:MAG: hypothetical protein K0R57_6062 [Paenibacillaceae bacterium]|jgi:hypothetical protein|nr:hypothetical protein [Paenibacillaceae bacterium]